MNNQNAVDGDFVDQAHDWGKEDALEGNDRRGSLYYLIGGLAHQAYNAGYDAGLKLKGMLLGTPVLETRFGGGGGSSAVAA